MGEREGVGEGVRGGRGLRKGVGEGGEMTQTLYPHMNLKKKEHRPRSELQHTP
jgi:hypothetical protein